MKIDHKSISKKIGLSLSKSLCSRVLNYYVRTYTGVIPQTYPMMEFATHRILSGPSQVERLNQLKVSKKAKSLDAGCGLGIFLALAIKSGYNFYGYEIDEELIGIARDLLQENDLPSDRVLSFQQFQKLKPNQFDFVTSFEVVEHVMDTYSYINDQKRVMKKGGRIFIETPNYVIPYEPHFYTFLPPGPRFLKMFFINRAKRTNYDFFNELNFVTKRSLEVALVKAGFTFQNLGQKEWLQALSEVPDERSIIFGKIARIIKKFHLMSIVVFLAKSGIYTPLVYEARLGKNKS